MLDDKRIYKYILKQKTLRKQGGKYMKEFSTLRILLLVLVVFSLVNVASAFKVREQLNPIEAKEFFADNLYISQTPLELNLVKNQLADSSKWDKFLAKHPSAIVFIDPRSGRPTTIVTPIPLIPGTGEGNSITLTDISRKVGYEVKSIGKEEVKAVALRFLGEYADILGIKTDEFGEVRLSLQSDYLWEVFIWRAVHGIPVRDSNVALGINHGNVTLFGVEKWGDINISLVPTISAERAVETAFHYIGGKVSGDEFIVKPHLEIIPVNPKNWAGAVGQGYQHHLVWAFTFRRPGFMNTWEFLVDAHTDQVLAFVDKNLYVQKKIVGMIYPVDNTGCPDTKGVAVQSGMPFTNTGLAAPNNYTDLGGTFEWSSGTVTTTLEGLYTRISDNCGSISESGQGDVDLGGTNGQHNCTVPSGHSAGDTFSSRSAAAEVTYVNRASRGWLNYSWLDNQLTANVNINNTCNAFWNGSTINFYRSGSGCGNTGEIAAVFDHEWSHGIDDNDTNGNVSNPGEVFADIVANNRLHTSCTGNGFFLTLNRGCGQWVCPSNSNITGYNCSGYNTAACCTSCSGVRDQDYAKHADNTPHTPANFICAYCGSGQGPCGKEVHCENAPAAEAVWDIAARDLQSAPFNMDTQTAFETAFRLILLGSGSVTDWYSCTCPSTSSGCGTNNGYMRFLTADADDGNINNGTPHMTAIYAAFNRHGIACATPTPTNQGCSGGPTAAPTVTGTPGDFLVSLSWTSVSGASSYYVFRTENTGSCDFGRVKLATVTGTTYTDNAVQNGVTYYYQVQAVGSSSACFGPLSACISVTPGAPSCTPPVFNGVQSVSDVNACTASGIQITWQTPSSWGQGATSGTFDVRRYTTSGCGGTYTTVATGLSASTTSYTDTTATAGTTYYYQVVAINNCSPPMSSTGTTSCSSGIVDNVDNTPCPAVGDNLNVAKSGTNANLTWSAVSCSDLANYRVYGSTTYDAPFPSGWTAIGNPTTTSYNDALTSSYIAYKVATVDACGNASN